MVTRHQKNLQKTRLTDLAFSINSFDSILADTTVSVGVLST